MRDYLFRGKTYDTIWKKGRWIYGSLIQEDGRCYILEFGEEAENSMNCLYLDREICTIDEKAIRIIPESIGQYIADVHEYDGSKQKPMKLFEGDIFRCIVVKETGELVAVAFWSEIYHAYMMAIYRNGDPFKLCTLKEFQSLLNMERVEHIGNTFDNPELINMSLK